VLHGYFSWYEKPALSLMYWGTLALHLLVQRRPATVILGALGVAIAFSNPVQLALCAENIVTLATRYTADGNPADGLSRASAWFPNVMDTVVEYRSKGWADSLGKILASPTLALLGLVAFGWIACRRWRDCVPLMPLLAISAFTFVSGPRFGMYLAPFVGLGLGIALSALIRQALRQPRSDLPRFALTAALACVFFGAWVQPSARRHQTIPSIAMPTEMIGALRIVAGHMPPAAAVWTWWEQGFALAHLFGFNVYHDGAVQYTPQTHVIAASLVGRDQASLSSTMHFVDARSNRGLDELAQRSDSRAALLRAIEASTVPADARRPKFLLLTHDMFEQASALRFLAGLPTATRDGESIYFEPLPCRALVDNVLRCKQLEIDLNSGSFSDGRTVRRVVIVDGVRVVRATDFANGGKAVLELVFGRDRRIRTFRVPDALYASNLNRMFMLGEYDRELFEEISLESDLVRLFRQKF
jgi:undecaprenyl-diphosphooligosaccharide--protein glycosyltransferase